MGSKWRWSPWGDDAGIREDMAHSALAELRREAAMCDRRVKHVDPEPELMWDVIHRYEQHKGRTDG